MYQQDIQFNSDVVVNLKYPDFKDIITSKNLRIQHITRTDSYVVFAFDENIVYVCTLMFKQYSAISVFTEDYTRAQNDIDIDDFEATLKASGNKTIMQRDIDGIDRIAVQKPNHDKINFYSHNFCDKTTWYQQSVRVADEVATPDGYYTTYSLSHQYVIDMYHGKITQEDYLKDNDGYTYRVIVKVDDTVKTEQDPHYASGGDYVVNYDSGTITFLSPLSVNNVVSVEYHYATNSVFTVTCPPGKDIIMDMAETQFSQNIGYRDSIIFNVYGYVDVFAPQLVGTGEGQFPSGTKIPIAEPSIYKTIQDLQNDSMKTYVAYPPLGMGDGYGHLWRSMTQPILIFEWDYLCITPLYYNYGMEIRVYLEHDNTFSGEFSTVTFYCSTLEP